MWVTAFTKYGREAASTRQRMLQFIPALRAQGIDLEHRPLLSNEYVRSLATGDPFSKASVGWSYARRLRQLLRPRPADLIWVYGELFPYLPSAFEQLVFRHGVPVIYDWDDAFFLPYDQHRRAIVRRLAGGKFEPVLRRAAAVTCGNTYLRDYCAQFCRRSVIVPTAVDTEIYRPLNRETPQQLTLGWIGSPSSWANVRPLLPLLSKICREQRARFRVIGAGVEAQVDQFEGLELWPWSEATEVAQVQQFDIGIMPLVDAPFQQGKSGYKLVQYMACGIPAVASPVGVNSEILAGGKSGFLARTVGEWEQVLTALLGDEDLRRRTGAVGRERAVAHYSLAIHAPRLAELFREVACK